MVFPVGETAFLLIRHAQSELNLRGRWQGLTDAPLSAEGLAQARALAQALAGARLEALVSSPLERALATARAVAAPHGLALELEPDLRELDLGEWGGMTRAEIGLRWPAELACFDAGDADARPPGGETRRELGLRVGRAAAQLARRHAGRRIALVTHLGVIAALLPGVRLGPAEHRLVAAESLDLAGLAVRGVAARAGATERGAPR
jgi:probable phosphoglycerate mutase